MRKLIGFVAAIGFFTAADAGRADDRAEIQLLVAKAIKAHGGEEKLDQFKASIVKMKITVRLAGSFDMAATAWMQMPGQAKTENEFEVGGKKIRRLQVVNGDRGWIKSNGVVVDMNQEAIAQEKWRLYVDWAANTLRPLRDKAYQLSTAGEARVKGSDAFGVRIEHKDRKDLTFYFGKKTGLLVKSEWRLEPLPGQKEGLLAEVFYSDYKEFAGVKRATKVSIGSGGVVAAQSVITDYQGVKKLDDSVFAKP